MEEEMKKTSILLVLWSIGIMLMIIAITQATFFSETTGTNIIIFLGTLLGTLLMLLAIFLY